jgi:hypothetical protein
VLFHLVLMFYLRGLDRLDLSEILIQKQIPKYPQIEAWASQNQLKIYLLQTCRVSRCARYSVAAQRPFSYNPWVLDPIFANIAPECQEHNAANSAGRPSRDDNPKERGRVLQPGLLMKLAMQLVA